MVDGFGFDRTLERVVSDLPFKPAVTVFVEQFFVPDAVLIILVAEDGAGLFVAITFGENAVDVHAMRIGHAVKIRVDVGNDWIAISKSPPDVRFSIEIVISF